MSKKKYEQLELDLGDERVVKIKKEADEDINYEEIDLFGNDGLIEYFDDIDRWQDNPYAYDPCISCPNNPLHGGTGFCNCTLPLFNKVYCIGY